MTNILYLALILLAIKFALNLSKYLQCKYYLEQYQRQGKVKGWKFVEQSLQVIKLFKEAGVEDTTVPFLEVNAIGTAHSGRVSVFSNIAVKRQDVINHVLAMFHQAIGVYRARMIETINPLYWIEVLIYLPRHILQYLGVSPESVFTKVFQSIYWLLSFLFTLYKLQFGDVLKNLIAKYF